VEIEEGVANQVVVSLHFPKPRKDLYQVLNVRDGVVVHIQDYHRRQEARQVAGLAS
jgi:hypothetical protein